MEDFDLTERLITAAEFSAILRVDEDDVLRWMLAGRIPYVDGPEGEPLVRIHEEHSVDGPMSQWIVCYSIDREPEFEAEVAHRQREIELDELDWGGVDPELLADALASRLRAVAPSVCRVSAEAGMIYLRDANGHGAGVDVAAAASSAEHQSDAQRVRSAAATFLGQAQDELAEVTTDPWPRHGSGEFPTPRAEIVDDGATVRMFYGARESPVLELEPVRVAQVLAHPNR